MPEDRKESLPLPHIAYSLIIAFGLGLSLFTVLLAVVPFDCGLGDCASISQSPYGRIFGIPVGLFAFLLWSSLYLDFRYISLTAKAGLVGGSVYFIYLQAAVIGKVCPYCAAHAVLCFLLIPFWRARRPCPFPAFLAIAGAVAGLLYLEYLQTRPLDPLPPAEAEKEVVPAPAVEIAPEALVETDSPVSEPAPGNTGQEVEVSGTVYLEGIDIDPQLALPWLSAEPYPGRMLVVSLHCRKCIMALGLMLRAKREGAENIVPLLWKTDDNTLPATRLFVAAVLSRTELAADAAFAQAFNVLASTKEWFNNPDTSVIDKLLRAEFPGLDDYLDEADRILARHHQAVSESGISVSPTLVVGSRAFRAFPLEELHP